MQEIVTIREANQHLSRYLEQVERGAEIIITRRGKTVASLMPLARAGARLSEAQQAAPERFRGRMSHGYPLGGTRVDRETLHERGR